jgi:Big-like domain-containing protein/PKD domain-containing protein
MLAHTVRRNARGLVAVVTALTCLSVTLVSSSCDKVPLLAPTGSVITLFPTATTVPSNGSMEIIATVIEQGVAQTTGTGAGGGTATTPTSTSTAGAGTPVQNGTLVSFTTTIGRIEPSEARTNNGQARVTYYANGQSGTATITAFSGGASGKLENLKVGSAGAERVLITASPQALPCTGGPSQIAARVEDVSGVGLPDVPVTFTTTRGQLNPSSATTDSTGSARTTLSTSQEATVTANAAGKTATATVTISPRTGISITPPTGQLSAGVATSFTVGVASTATITNVSLTLGDGTTRNLGPISQSVTVPHTYRNEGTYTVTATATDASGCSEQVSTAVTVLPGQPPSVIITASDTTPAVGQAVTFTATVSGNTSTIIRYDWSFGSGAVPSTTSTTSNRQSVVYGVVGTYTVTVVVTQASGPQGDGQTAVVVGTTLTGGDKR